MDEEDNGQIETAVRDAVFEASVKEGLVRGAFPSIKIVWIDLHAGTAEALALSRNGVSIKVALSRRDHGEGWMVLNTSLEGAEESISELRIPQAGAALKQHAEYLQAQFAR